MRDIIFTVAIERDERSKTQSYDYSIKSWEKWCSKNGKELFVLKEDITDPNYIRPNWYKYFVFDLLEASGISDYENVAFVDADTIVHPDTPDFFQLTNGKFGVVENYGSLDWVLRSIEIYGDKVFDGLRVPHYEYFNSGFMAFNKRHKPFFADVLNFLQKNRNLLVEVNSQYGIGHDQTPVNLLIEKHGIEKEMLSYKYNFQDFMRREALFSSNFEFVNYAYIYHFNCGVKPSPGYWIENTYKYFYGTN